jgi:hypothetical protein
MIRSNALVFTFTLIAVPAGAQSATPAQEHIHWQEFKNKLRWKDSLIKTMIGASWAEARNSPHEWNRTWGGFGKRAASSYGQRLIKGATELSISSTLTHEDLRYHKSNQEGAWPRLKFALVRTLWVPRDVGDGHTFAAGRVTGAFVAGQLSRTWMPSRVATFNAGAQNMGLTLAVDGAVNVLKEFWPKKH